MGLNVIQRKALKIKCTELQRYTDINVSAQKGMPRTSIVAWVINFATFSICVPSYWPMDARYGSCKGASAFSEAFDLERDVAVGVRGCSTCNFLGLLTWRGVLRSGLAVQPVPFSEAPLYISP